MPNLWPWLRRNSQRNWVFFGACFVLFAVLRWYFAAYVVPQHLNPDEAALLLNARLLLESGKDEWGVAWPLFFKSFGDAKLPGYIWLVLATQWGLGAWLSDLWVTRLPAFVAGLILLPAAYLWVKSMTKSSIAAWWTVLFLAVSPWTWHFGSVGFEAQVGLTLFVFGLWQLWENRWWLAAPIFLTACLTYNTPWLLLPVVGLARLFWLWPKKAEIAKEGSVLAAIFLGILAATWSVASQKSGITIWSDATLWSTYAAYRAQFPGIFATLLGNRYVFMLWQLVKNWEASWSWGFLVLRGGQNPWHGIPFIGHVHPLLPIVSMWGALLLIWRASTKKLALLTLLVGSLLPAVITSDAPHATRSLFFFVMLAVCGGLWMVKSVKWWNGHVVWRGLLILALLWGVVWWWVPAPSRWEHLINWKWYPNLTETLQSDTVRSADRVVVVDLLGQAYVYAALATDMPASEFLATIHRSSADVSGIVRGERLGKFEFHGDDKNPGAGGIMIKQRGNASWDIIEL